MDDVSMGEGSRRRRRLLDDLTIGDPSCIYCTSPAATVEHMPPRIMFTNKHRPKGLEFASCKACNNGTRQSDLVAAFIGRSMTEGSGEAETHDLASLFRSVRNNIPDVLREMVPSSDQLLTAGRELPGQNVLNVGGPLVRGYMEQFAAKLTFALYREVSGRSVPQEGGAITRWFSNYEDRTGRVPKGLFTGLMPRRTLKQGSFEVPNQFAYSYEISPDGDFARIIATFRYAFAVAGFVAPHLDAFADAPVKPVQRGGLVALMPSTAA